MTFKSFLSLAVVAFVGIAGFTSTASASDFRCPSQQVTVTTSGIPYPWRGASQVLTLTSLKVEKSGASSFLTCVYGNGAMVLKHPAPAAEPNCKVVPPKFVCQPNNTAPSGGFISYNAPLATGLAPVVGRTLRQLTTTAEASVGPYAGVSMRGTQCSSCHTPPTGWTKSELCKRGQLFARNRARIFNSPTTGFVPQHPFGGQLKTAMANWAQTGCN